MNILGKMWDAVFKKGGKGAAPALKPIVKGSTTTAAATASSAAASPSVAAAAPAPVPPTPVIDVEEVLEALAAQSDEKLNWKTSIVDLMKLLGMESSLADRKALAAELHYEGSTKDTATMNMWLHKEVIRIFAENGGKVPYNLLD